ncbi:hypothetical protein [Ancylobacter mangrovi]|uniref:hypothetical protein n=1 Tax=Ancylobacter mangrovi TaxID=2972472 RepID=UPI0021631B79|nr:hypothetical protein [Ancylobacter mangrovi]MCS0502082.1 hypothetical protein [Ancylobacter mangrovi]
MAEADARPALPELLAAPVFLAAEGLTADDLAPALVAPEPSIAPPLPTRVLPAGATFAAVPARGRRGAESLSFSAIFDL